MPFWGIVLGCVGCMIACPCEESIAYSWIGPVVVGPYPSRPLSHFNQSSKRDSPPPVGELRHGLHRLLKGTRLNIGLASSSALPALTSAGLSAALLSTIQPLSLKFLPSTTGHAGGRLNTYPPVGRDGEGGLLGICILEAFHTLGHVVGGKDTLTCSRPPHPDPLLPRREERENCVRVMSNEQ